MNRPNRANRRAAWRLALASLAMFAFGYALVPLYDAWALGSGEGRVMPVRFFIDPALPKHITTVTLSYTFFRAPEKETAQLTRGQARDS